MTITLIDPEEIVGVTDIAERCTAAGHPVKATTVNSWRKRAQTAVTRKPMPPPDGHLAGSIPWWFWTATMVPWLTDTGRL